MNKEPLKFPEGEFTHTTLAEFNGLPGEGRKLIWTRYQKAIADGVIVAVGVKARSEKGTAPMWWRLAKPGEVVSPVVPSPAPVVTPVVKVPKVKAPPGVKVKPTPAPNV